LISNNLASACYCLTLPHGKPAVYRDIAYAAVVLGD